MYLSLKTISRERECFDGTSEATVKARRSDLDFSKLLEAGDRLVVSQMSGEPLSLTRALVAQRDRFPGVEIFVGVLNETAFTSAAADRLRFRSFGAMGNARPLHALGALEILPISLGQIAGAIAAGRIGCDVALVQLTPTNDPERFGFGLTSDYMRAAVDRARLVIAEVNLAAPRTVGAESVHLSEIDILVNSSEPPAGVVARAPRVVDRQIAAHVADLISDGSTLQAGIGTVPEALMALIGDRRDLGYHAGMLGDGAAALMRSGALTNARKSIDCGQTVAAMISGSDELMRFVHENSAISLRASSYTNAVPVIAAQERFIALNSALEVDLTGAVNAEAIAGKQIGGIGGLPDFVTGALAARSGRSIIALPATAGQHGASRIVSRLSGPTTLPAYLADIVVTEFGRAELRGRSICERARALIAIAAPSLRRNLHSQAVASGLIS